VRIDTHLWVADCNEDSDNSGLQLAVRKRVSRPFQPRIYHDDVLVYNVRTPALASEPFILL
jgi:hypothetical protein